MPEKRHVKGCGKSCIRCWVNRQKHGNKLKKKFFPKKFEMNKSWMSEEKVYMSDFEEFLDKFVISNYIMKVVWKLIYDEVNPVEHNNNLIKKTTNAYNNWLLKEKGINKKMKEKDLIKEMNGHYKNSDILDSKVINMYPIVSPDTEDIPKCERFYMFDCTYKV